MFQNPDWPTPRLGWDRQQKKAKEIAEKLAALGANKSKLSQFAEGGMGMGPRRGRFAAPGAAARMAAMMRRAGPMMSPLRGIGAGHGMAAFSRGGVARPAVHVNPAVRTPQDPGYQPGQRNGNIAWSGQHVPGFDLTPMPLSGLEVARQQDPVFDAIMRGETVGLPYQGAIKQAVGAGQVFHPSDVGGRPGQTQTFQDYGNLIPLGGGAYIDGSTGAIYGMGGSGSTLGMV